MIFTQYGTWIRPQLSVLPSQHLGPGPAPRDFAYSRNIAAGFESKAQAKQFACFPQFCAHTPKITRLVAVSSPLKIASIGSAGRNRPRGIVVARGRRHIVRVGGWRVGLDSAVWGRDLTPGMLR